MELSALSHRCHALLIEKKANPIFNFLFRLFENAFIFAGCLPLVSNMMSSTQKFKEV